MCSKDMFILFYYLLLNVARALSLVVLFTLTVKESGSVLSALSNWRVQSRCEDSAQFPNFVTLNREAVKAGLVTSNEMSRYRAQRGEAANLDHAPRQPQGRASGRQVSVPNITFGVTSR